MEKCFAGSLSTRKVVSFLKKFGYNIISVLKLPDLSTHCRILVKSEYSGNEDVFELRYSDFEVEFIHTRFIGETPPEFDEIQNEVWASMMFSSFGREYYKAYAKYKEFKSAAPRIWKD